MKTLPKIITQPKHPVVLLKASSNYTYLTYSNGKKEVSAYSLKVFADYFAIQHFIRINRSFLVNTDFVLKHICKEGKDYFLLKNNSVVAIPRRKAAKLKSLYPSLFK